jgi:hypothetical protein
VNGFFPNRLPFYQSKEIRMRFPGLSRPVLLAFLLILLLNGPFFSGNGPAGKGSQPHQLRNTFVSCSVGLCNGMLSYDRIEYSERWKSDSLRPGDVLDTDSDFNLNVVWTGWRAPGKRNNAENPVCLSKKDFRFLRSLRKTRSDGAEELSLFFKGIKSPFELKLTYRLGADSFYVRRKLEIRDPETSGHFLQRMWSRYGRIGGQFTFLNKGGFGQPLAFQNSSFGVFIGKEYPASENVLIEQSGNEIIIGCGQEIGSVIGADWLGGEWVVSALTPPDRVKFWFMRYIDDIRAAPLKPYLLYNTWYDLRAPEMVKSSENVMNEENLMRIARLFEENLKKPFGLHLDAFVLDDGWDVYRSDWRLRTREFPRGLKPFSEYLRKQGTALGVWLGPTGGYSHRDWRIGWMKRSGYEVVGDQLCLAGHNYKKLFKKRVVDFVTRDRAGYFKWDGIQFSCSEPGHGHPIGLNSRRAVMDSVADLCRTVRQADPDIFLNITSGTWLSPWWVKYANTIWMQGYDYGYADVPSISRRDRAMTYRDTVLFEGLRKNNCWFPLANLMTHGIIKGHLQMLGGDAEPLDKFTDNALLYTARGVSMWELYVSPDLLTPEEWQAIAGSIMWARSRFPILIRTEMIGGDPGQRRAYGFEHTRDNRSIIAVRNPVIDATVISLRAGVISNRPSSSPDLVLERIYPTRWISPRLLKAGDMVVIPLEGFETAIYEVYPLEEAPAPLLADAVFETDGCRGDQYHIRVLKTGPGLRLLNPALVERLSSEGRPVDPVRLDFRKELSYPVLEEEDVRLETGSPDKCLKAELRINDSMEDGNLAVLIESRGKRFELPQIQALRNGQDLEPKVLEQKGKWKWIQIPVSPGRHSIEMNFNSPKGSVNLSVWLISKKRFPPTPLTFQLTKQSQSPPQPPRPWPDGIMRQVIKLKAFTLGEG